MLGYDLGVAVTGSEKLGLTLIITEGFGEIAMLLAGGLVLFARLSRLEGAGPFFRHLTGERGIRTAGIIFGLAVSLILMFAWTPFSGIVTP